MGDGPNLAPKEGKDSKAPANTPDLLTYGLAAARLAGGWQAEVALAAFRAATPKLLESTLPLILLCTTPVKVDKPQPFLDDAQARFRVDDVGGLGEGFELANKKVKDFANFNVVDEAKLKAYWIFTKANDRKPGVLTAADKEAEEAFCLAFRKNLDDADRKLIKDKDLLTADDKKRLGPKALEPLTYEEEMRLKALTAKTLLAKAKDMGGASSLPDKEDASHPVNEKKLFDECRAAVLDRATWSKKAELIPDAKDSADVEKSKTATRWQLDDAYLKIIEDRVSKLRLNSDDEYGNPRAKEWISQAYTYKKDSEGRVSITVTPGYEDAVITKSKDIKDKAEAAKALATEDPEKAGVTREQLLYYWLLSETGWKGKPPAVQESKGILPMIGSIFEQKEGNGGKPFTDKTGPSPFRTKKPKPPNTEETSIPEWFGYAAKALVWGGPASWVALEAYLSTKAVAEGKLPFRTIIGPAKWVGRRLGIGADKGADDATTRLRDDRMYEDRVRTEFRSQAEAVIRGLDPKDADAGKKLGKMMNDFAAVEKLDPRAEDGRLKVEVKFSTDPVTESDGMLKGKIEFSPDGTKVTLTFPTDAKPGELGHDCHLALYEIGRSGKGKTALKPIDRAAITRMYNRLHVDYTGRSDASARDASSRLPDRGTGASTAPIEINFTADGVTIAGEKFTIDKVTEAIRDELKEKVDKLERDGKKAGDAEYDAAKKAYNEHRLLAEDLRSGDNARSDAARTRALDKVKSAFEADDGKLAERFREDLRKAGGEEKGRSRAVVLSMLAARFAAPTAAVLVGVGLLGSNSARASEVKRAPIVPIIIPKKEDK